MASRKSAEKGDAKSRAVDSEEDEEYKPDASDDDDTTDEDEDADDGRPQAEVVEDDGEVAPAVAPKSKSKSKSLPIDKANALIAAAAAPSAKRKGADKKPKPDLKKVKRTPKKNAWNPLRCLVCDKVQASEAEIFTDEELTGGPRGMCIDCYEIMQRKKRCDLCSKACLLPTSIGLTCQCKTHEEWAIRCVACCASNPILANAITKVRVIPGFCSKCTDASNDAILYNTEPTPPPSVSVAVAAAAPAASAPVAAPASAAAPIAPSRNEIFAGFREAKKLPCRFVEYDSCPGTSVGTYMFCYDCKSFQCRDCMIRCKEVKCRMFLCVLCISQCTHVRPVGYSSDTLTSTAAVAAAKPAVAVGGTIDTKHKDTPLGKDEKSDLKSLLVKPKEKSQPKLSCSACSKRVGDEKNIHRCQSCSDLVCNDCVHSCKQCGEEDDVWCESCVAICACGVTICSHCDVGRNSDKEYRCDGCNARNSDDEPDGAICNRKDCDEVTTERCAGCQSFACKDLKCRKHCMSCLELVCFHCIIPCSTKDCTGTACAACTKGKSGEPTQVDIYCANCTDL